MDPTTEIFQPYRNKEEVPNETKLAMTNKYLRDRVNYETTVEYYEENVGIITDMDLQTLRYGNPVNDVLAGSFTAWEIAIEKIMNVLKNDENKLNRLFDVVWDDATRENE